MKAETLRSVPTPEELAAKRKREEELAPILEAEFKDFSDRGSTPYMKRKLILKLYGARIKPNPKGDPILVVPLRDVEGKFWNYQRIFSTKFKQADGKEVDKFTAEGGRSKGTFHLLGEICPESTVYLAEGFATAVSVFKALGENAPVVVSLYAANLPEVAGDMLATYPGVKLVVCADNDQWKVGKGNAGREWALRTQALHPARIEVRYPVFPNVGAGPDGKGPSDFNDLETLTHLETVKAQLFDQAPEPTLAEECRELECIATFTAKGIPQKPSQKKVVDYLLDHYGDRLIAQDEDFFLYGDGYWQHQDKEGRKRLKRQISFVGGPAMGIQDIENTLKLLAVQTASPPPGTDLFASRYFNANFTNGTLHYLQATKGGRPELEFRPHNRLDYITNQLPFAYPGPEGENVRNPDFDEMLARVFLGDPDKDIKIRALAQLYGAVLMPCFPKIFFLVGARGSGKSTVMKILFRLADKKNVCHVDPADFGGFNMENMAGKLLNLDTDIDLHRPIRDSVIKKICDRLPFRIRRKGVRDLDAPLPPIHVWGCNEPPQSLEGATGAYGRRVVLFRFGAYSAEAQGEGGYDLEFDRLVWEAGPEGIIAFALRGLRDLLELRGHFTVPESSKEMMAEWDERSDLVAQFLDAIRHQELDGNDVVLMGPEEKIQRRTLWEICMRWQKGQFGPMLKLSSRGLYAGLRKKGFAESKSGRVRYFEGFASKPSPDRVV